MKQTDRSSLIAFRMSLQFVGRSEHFFRQASLRVGAVYCKQTAHLVPKHVSQLNVVGGAKESLPNETTAQRVFRMLFRDCLGKSSSETFDKNSQRLF
jgi:hypothetical protein